VLGGAAVAWPLPLSAQQPTLPVIGFISAGSRDTYVDLLAAFRQGLKETGYVEGQTVAIESRWADGQFDRLPRLAAELVQRRVAVIATTGGSSSRAAMAASRTIPIVFLSQSDPINSGFVASFNRPGGNATGMALLTAHSKAAGACPAIGTSGRAGRLSHESTRYQGSRGLLARSAGRGAGHRPATHYRERQQAA
jgi:ABC-type uncharacterized transport system substrate-binding protein